MKPVFTKCDLIVLTLTFSVIFENTLARHRKYMYTYKYTYFHQCHTQFRFMIIKYLYLVNFRSISCPYG